MRANSPITGFVQICPNDRPPFLDLCRVYAKAAGSLGLASTTVFLRSPGVDPIPADGHYLNATDLRDTGAVAVRLRGVLHDVRDSLVLCHRYRSYRVFARSGLRGGKVIALAHEHGFFKRPSRRLARRLIAGKILFAGVSPSVARELEATVGEALHLPNALDLDALTWSDRAAARRELGLPRDGICLGVVGRLHYKKNPELAVEAFRLYSEQRADAHLVFVGDGPLLESLNERVAGLAVIFAGFVPDARRFMRAFDALVMPSRKVEGFGMSALEAMAAGVPVVAPRAGGFPSVLGELGYYFDRAEPGAVAAALRDAIGAGPLLAGMERAQREFSVAAVARRLDSLRNLPDSAP